MKDFNRANIKGMYKKYTTPLPSYGMWVVERHLEMAQPTKKHQSLEIKEAERQKTDKMVQMIQTDLEMI